MTKLVAVEGRPRQWTPSEGPSRMDLMVDEADPNKRRLTRDEAVELLSRPLGRRVLVAQRRRLDPLGSGPLPVGGGPGPLPRRDPGCEDAERRANGSRNPGVGRNDALAGEHPGKRALASEWLGLASHRPDRKLRPSARSPARRHVRTTSEVRTGRAHEEVERSRPRNRRAIGSLSDRLQPAYKSPRKKIREAMSDRGRGVRSKGERRPTRGIPDYRRREPRP